MSRVVMPDTAFALDRVGKRERRIEEPAHLAFIRTLPSVISGMRPVEAAHIRFGDPRHRKPMTGMQRKPDDFYVLPLTPEEHRSQHAANERTWWAGHGIDDPCQIALEIHAVTGDEDAALKIIRAVQRRTGGSL